MSLSKFRAKRAAVKAERQKPTPPPKGLQPDTVPGDYALMAALVKQDIEHLKAEFPDDHAARNKAKGEVLKKYRQYLTDWMQAGQTHQNDVLVQNVMWALDSTQYEWMLELADYAIKTNQAITWVKRNLATIIADTVVQAADDQLIRREGKKRMGGIQAETPELKDLEVIFKAMLERVEHWPLSAKNIIRAQYAMVAGFLAERDKNWPDAARWYGLADELKPDIGVKGRLKEAEKNAKTAAIAPTTQSTTLAGATAGKTIPTG